MNIGIGTLLTHGLGGTGFSALMYGPFCVWVENYIHPPSPPTDIGWGAGGGSNWKSSSWNDDPLQIPEKPKTYKVTFTTKITKNKSIRREFIVDENQKKYLLKRIGQINTYIVKFNVLFTKISKVFEIKWKK